MTDPLVDVVVPVHNPNRPIERAIGSLAQESRRDVIRATVVCHDMESEPIRSRLAAFDGAMKVRVVEHGDGVPSPAGPKNYGLQIATARYVATLDSDDWVERDAVSTWIEYAQSGADVVLPRLRHQDGSVIRAPMARPFRKRRLDLVRDRLAYRTAALGLIRRDLVDDLKLRFTAGLRTGEDLSLGLRLYTSRCRIDYARSAPAYMVADDASDRVTGMIYPLSDELAALRLVLEGEWFKTLPDAMRASIAVKFVRMPIHGAIVRRGRAGLWSDEDRRVLKDVVEMVLHSAPRVSAPLSVAEHRLLEIARDPSAWAGDLISASRRSMSVSSFVTKDVTGILSRESPLRRAFARLFDEPGRSVKRG